MVDLATKPAGYSVDEEPNDSAMIALLPVTTDWCKIKLPHMTLVFAGEISKLNPGEFNEMAKDASSLALMTRSIYLKIKQVEVLGDPGQEVDAFCFELTPELAAMRRFVDHWNASEYPFKPHTTIGPKGSYDQMRMQMGMDRTPPAMAFDRIMCAWGEDQLVFNLRG